MAYIQEQSGYKQDTYLCDLITALFENVKSGQVKSVLSKDINYSISGSVYFSSNAEKCRLLMMTRGFSYPVFGTANKWKELGGYPRKGSTSLSLSPGCDYRLKDSEGWDGYSKITYEQLLKLPKDEQLRYQALPSRGYGFNVFNMDDIEGLSDEFKQGMKELFEGKRNVLSFSKMVDDKGNPVADLVIPDDVPAEKRSAMYTEGVLNFFLKNEFNPDGKKAFAIWEDDTLSESVCDLEARTIRLPAMYDYSSDMEYCADLFRHVAYASIRLSIGTEERYEKNAFFQSLDMKDKLALHSLAAELGASTVINRLGEPYFFTEKFVESIDNWMSFSEENKPEAIKLLAYEAGQASNRICKEMGLAVKSLEDVRKDVKSAVEKTRKALELGNETVKADKDNHIKVKSQKRK